MNVEPLNKWYLAEVLLRVENRSSCTCKGQINLVLIQAGCADEAYTRAVEIGQQADCELLSNAGDSIDIKFIGLKNLHRIYETQLMHGAEILYEEIDVRSDEQLAAMVRRREEMNAFSHLH
jgi:hypothetical protein